MLLLIETSSIKKYFRGLRMTEVIRALRLATDGHEENGIGRANKMRRIVRQCATADRIMRRANHFRQGWMSEMSYLFLRRRCNQLSEKEFDGRPGSASLPTKRHSTARSRC